LNAVLNDGSKIPFGLGVWATGTSFCHLNEVLMKQLGVAPVELIQKLPVAKNPSKRVLVNEYLLLKEPPLPNGK
jgi:hypothetical protein